MKGITIRYEAVDGARACRGFATLAGAQRYAQAKVGAHPEIGRWYAVSADGIGKVTAEGVSLAELFPSPRPTWHEAQLAAAVQDTLVRRTTGRNTLRGMVDMVASAIAPRVRGFGANDLEELRTVLEKQERHGAECHILVDCLVCYHLVQREADARRGFEFLPLA